MIWVALALIVAYLVWDRVIRARARKDKPSREFVLGGRLFDLYWYCFGTSARYEMDAWQYA